MVKYGSACFGLVKVPSWLKKGLWVGVPSPFGFGRTAFQSQKCLFVSWWNKSQHLNVKFGWIGIWMMMAGSSDESGNPLFQKRCYGVAMWWWGVGLP